MLVQQPNSASQVTGAIRQAAQSTGANFDYLLATAKIESNLNPSAQAPTSSAKGLFQFIEQTWLSTMKSAGSALGLNRFSDAIVQNADGRFEVADTGMRDTIMKLRGNPTVSAAMAGAFTQQNSEQLRSSIGRQPTEGELYIAHFLGPDGAGRLINGAVAQPSSSAASSFPAAASANKSIFFDRAGKSRSMLDVYRVLTGKYETAKATAGGASAPMLAQNVTAPVRTGIVPSARVASVPDTAGMTAAYADANANLPPVPDTKPLFQAMFTTRERQQPIGQVVSSLWNPVSRQPLSQQPLNQLELFTDTKPDARKIFGAG